MSRYKQHLYMFSFTSKCELVADLIHLPKFDQMITGQIFWKQQTLLGQALFSIPFYFSFDETEILTMSNILNSYKDSILVPSSLSLGRSWIQFWLFIRNRKKCNEIWHIIIYRVYFSDRCYWYHMIPLINNPNPEAFSLHIFMGVAILTMFS